MNRSTDLISLTKNQKSWKNVAEAAKLQTELGGA